MLRAALAIVWVSVVIGCGGGGDAPVTPIVPPAKRLQVAYVHGDTAAVKQAFPSDLSILPLHEADVDKSLLLQDEQVGNKVLFGGFTKATGFSSWPELLAKSASRVGYTHAYVYDEAFWGNDGQIHIGMDEDAINTAADQAIAYGYKTVITLMPWVVLHPDFAMTSINKFDVIVLDLYPSTARMLPSGLNNDLHGCKHNDNLMTNLMVCSIQKLRAQGFKGEVWYAYQAFKINGTTNADLLADLMLQRETLLEAASLGITGIAAFGFDLSQKQVAEESITPLRGTQFESLLLPPL